MNKLNSISIKYVKGINDVKFILELYPNKPSILVAPNGFGKTSIACAFNSLQKNKIELNDKDYHCNNESNLPQVCIEKEKQNYLANIDSNNISDVFDISVINDLVIAKATKRNMGGFTHASASLELKNIVLISSVPEKVDFEYSSSYVKEKYGRNSKVLPNLQKQILNNLEFMYLFSKQIAYSVFKKKREYLNPINSIIELINTKNDTASNLLAWIKDEVFDKFIDIPSLNNLAQLINKTVEPDIVKSHLLAMQLADLTLDKNFKKALHYKLYLKDKIFYNNLLSNINTTRFKLEVKEKRKSKQNATKKLLIEFPPVYGISNGQRDIISFIVQIQKARQKFQKKHCILIIDEIFDYLDDANLVAFQYYITLLIEEFKKQNRYIYPFLLTHLDPFYFRHFCFNRHKMQIRYLAATTSHITSIFLNLVKNRNNEKICNEVSKHHFHYHPENINLEKAFFELNLRKKWAKSHQFYEILEEEINKYLLDHEYDPVAVLLGCRIQIEKNAYNKLPNDKKNDFLLTHKTKSKLEFCEDNTIQLPETYYLLGIIYNDDLHWRNNRDYETPLYSKLENLTIKNMISEVFKS